MAHLLKTAASAAVLLTSMLIVTPTSAAAVLSVQPPSINLGVGNTSLLDIVIEDVTDLYSCQFDVGFDPGNRPRPATILLQPFAPDSDTLLHESIVLLNIVHVQCPSASGIPAQLTGLPSVLRLRLGTPDVHRPL